jgi:hypothetical protein
MSFKIRWKRGSESLNFSAPQVFFCLGGRGSGKSSLLETIGTNYLQKGHALFDLWASRDGEGLAWLRSPYAKDKKILLLKGENVDVKGNYETKNAMNLTLYDLNKYDMIISASPFYLSIDQEYVAGGHTIDTLYQRLHYKRLIYCICREAANLFYSRLRVSDNQLAAKAQTAYLLRESRHLGVSMGLDSLRFSAIDCDIRSLADYTFLKAQGANGLSKDLKWLYSFIDAGLLRNMETNRFVLLCRSGAIGFGVFEEVPWHKTANENILDNLGFKVEYGEQLEGSVDKGSFKTVSDVEHTQILKLYIEDGLSMIEIGKKMNRSSRTPKVHIDSHNNSIGRSGFCAPCKRAQSKFSSMIAGKGLS